MNKFKVGDIVEWIDDSGVWIIEEIIDIFAGLDRDLIEVRCIWCRNDVKNDPDFELVEEFDLETYNDNDSCQLSASYIKTKEFNKDLEDLVKE